MKRYPQHEKLKAVVDKTQFVGDFLEYLEEKGLYLTDKDNRYGSWSDHLYKFIGVDRWKLEDEKRAMIEEHVKLTEKS